MTNKVFFALFVLFVSLCGCKKDSPTEPLSPDQTPELLGAPNNTMIHVAGGTFQMGSDNQDNPFTHPQHTVIVGSFYIDNYEILYDKWMSVTAWGAKHGYSDLQDVGANGFNSAGRVMMPVAAVSWYDAVKWCNARSEMDGRTPVYYTNTSLLSTQIYRVGMKDISNTMVNWKANGYRLPTEAEWEYAAKGGTKAQVPTPFMYSGSNTVDSVAWFLGNANNATYARELKKPNELGIYDMSGNVMEWCWDWYLFIYPSGTVTDPKGESTGDGRVLRGGSYNSDEGQCRSLARFYWEPYGAINESGLRCVKIAP